MTALSDYAENELLDHLLRTGAFTAPTNTYVQLHTGAPGEAGTANVAATNTRNQLSWAAASSRSISTNTDETWTSAASETISHISIWDASTSGNCIAVGALTAGVATGGIGNTFTISSGNITLDFSTIAGSFSTYGGNAALDHITGRAAWTMPAGLFVQLHTGDPGLAGTSNVATTSTRVSAGAFSAASGGTSDNDAAISFTGAATETITHFTLWDAASSGNCLWVAAVTTSRAITSGQTVRFSAGELDVTLA